MFEIITLLQEIFTLDWINAQLTSNDFLVAGVFAALAYLLRSIPNRIWAFINRQISIEFSITNEDGDYEDIVKFLEEKRLKIFSRTFTKKKISGIYDEHKTTDELTIGYGSSWFIMNGVLGYINRQFKDSNHSNKLKEEIFVKLFTRNITNLETIIEKSTQHKKIDDNSIKCYLPESTYWNMNSKITKRTFDTVFIDPTIKEELKTSLDEFLKNKQWYIDKGIPYKFGIFIEGLPGVGKTSIVKAICSYLNRDIYFMTSAGFSENSLPSLVGDLCANDNSVLVLEEIDTFDSTSKRKSTKGEEEKTNNMSVILNVLDGALTPDNFIFIATTNHYDKVDPALKRPGRFDLIIHLDKLSYEVFKEMVSKLFEVSEKQIDKDFKNCYVPITGSEIQGIFILEKDYSKAKSLIKEKIDVSSN